MWAVAERESKIFLFFFFRRGFKWGIEVLFLTWFPAADADTCHMEPEIYFGLVCFWGNLAFSSFKHLPSVRPEGRYVNELLGQHGRNDPIMCDLSFACWKIKLLKLISVVWISPDERQMLRKPLSGRSIRSAESGWKWTRPFKTCAISCLTCVCKSVTSVPAALGEIICCCKTEATKKLMFFKGGVLRNGSLSLAQTVS